MTPEDIRSAFRRRLIPAVPVPCDAHGNIERELHARYIAWMNTQAVGAIAVWAHTGRGLRLNPDQRLEILEAWKLGCSAPVVAGVGVPSDTRLPTDKRSVTDAAIRAAVQMAQEARNAGATCVLVHPPTVCRDLPDRDTRVVAYHEAIGEVLPTIVFYLYEAAGGIPYSNDVTDQLVSMSPTVGIKLATLDDVERVREVCELLAERPDVLLVTGEDRFLGTSIQMGADTALIGMGAALTDVFAGLLALSEEDTEAVDVLSKAIDAYAAVTFAEPVDGYVQRMLWALHDDDVLPVDTRDPFGPDLDTAERRAVRDAVAALRAVS